MQRFTVIMAVILFAEVLISMILIAASSDLARPLWIGFGITVTASITIFWLATLHLTVAEVPDGSAAVVTGLDGKKNVVAGKTTIADVLPFVEKVQIHSLLQKPLDLACEYETLDRITVRVSISVLWEVHPDSLLSVLENSDKFTVGLARLIESTLNFQIGSHCLADIRLRTPIIADSIRHMLNLPEYSDRKYRVKQLAITCLRLPAELTYAATQQDIAWNRRSEKFWDRVVEAAAYARELRLLNRSVESVDPRTLDCAENLLIWELLGRK